LSQNNLHTEKELLLLASEGCAESFTEIFHLYNNRLYGFLLKITKSEQQSLDFIQDIFMKLWTNRVNLANIDDLGRYIFISAQNHAINAFKHKMNEIKIHSKLLSYKSYNDVEDNLEYKILETKLNGVINKLPSQQKLVYTLSRLDGLKYEEIANELQISPATVKNHMVQALRNIKDCLRNDLNIAYFFYVLIYLGIRF
jgi:RNA polymerase sigma-70 factor (ECF subfamily)